MSPGTDAPDHADPGSAASARPDGTDRASQQRDAQDQATQDTVAPDLAESLRQIGITSRAGFGAAGDAAEAFRKLLAADVSLARSAFGRTLAFTGVAIVFGASSWLLLMAGLIVYLTRGLGVPWTLAMLLCALASGAVAGWAIWQGQRYFEHTRLQATRRQLARLGIGELADFSPSADSAVSTRAATERVATQTPDGKPPKDDLGIDVTPP